MSRRLHPQGFNGCKESSVHSGGADTWRGARSRSIAEMLAWRLRECASSAALHDDHGAAVDSRRLFEGAAAVSSFLIEAGVPSGGRVGLATSNGLPLATALLGVMSFAEAAPLDPASSEEEVDRWLDLLRPSVVLLSSGMQRIEKIALGRGVKAVFLEEVAAASRDRPSPSAPAPLGDPDAYPHPDNVALVLTTSGTTGDPKLVPLTHQNLLVAAYQVAATLELDGSDRCLNVMPLIHTHGLVAGLLAPLVSGGSAICTPTSDPYLMRLCLDRQAPTWYTAVPTVHKNLLQHLHASPTPPAHQLRLIRSISAPLPVHVLEELETVFGVPVVEGYALTEAPGEVTSNSPARAARRAGTVGRPTLCEVRVLRDGGRSAAPMERGEVVIRGPNVITNYVGSSHGEETFFEGDWFRTGDEGFVDDDGYLTITGRLKEQINRGGEKVSPREVDDVLIQLPGVAAAATFPVPHPILGEDVAAAVVRDPGARLSAQDVREFVASRISWYKVPKAIHFVESLPVTATGKVRRSELPHLVDSTAPRGTRAGAAGEGGALEIVLKALWGSVLETPEFDIDDSFLGLGGDSLRAARLVASINGALGVELPFTALFRECSTIRQLAETIERERAAPGIDGKSIQRVAREGDELELSFAQQRLWFLDQLEPGGAEYKLVRSYRLKGTLDRAALQQSLSEIVARHEALRTTFVTVDDRPVQVVSPPAPVALELVDLGELADKERLEAARRLASEESQRPFELDRGPLLRVTLLRLDDDDHVLVLVMHHIVSDGWSMGVFTRELTALYEAFSQGRPSPLEPLAIHYPDYALWQRRYLAGETLEAQLSYWKDKLKGLPPVLELPTDHPRPAVKTSRGATVAFELDPDLLARLKELSRGHDATLFMTLLAAFQTLLSRYSGRDDIAVGTPAAGRTRSEIEPLIGFFVNTLVMRGDLSGDPSFSELLKRVRDTALGAYAHQDVPFEKLVDELQPERDLSHTPLFQVMFALQRLQGQDALRLSGLDLEPFNTADATAKFDLTLELVESDDAVGGRIEYNADLFEPDTIARMAGHLANLLKAIAATPEAPLSQLDMLDDDERRLVLVDWNDTATDYPSDRTIHELFEAQAARAPEATALVSGDDTLTYGELNARANQLAHHLRSLGVGPDTLVGICVERSARMVVGLLGILKAGGAYVPLDPDYPPERLAFMLQDSAAPVLVTEHDLTESLSDTDAEIVCLDSRWDAIAAHPTSDPEPLAGPQDLAYVIYTSGSTGRPKGVMVEHQGVVNRLVWMQRAYDIHERDGVVQKTPFSFDVSVWEFFWPLLVGARLVVARPGGHRDPAYLSELMARHNVTIAHFVPSMLRAFVDQAQLPATLKKVICSGEELTPDLALEVLRSSSAELHNLYGPTEASIDVTAWPCSEQWSEDFIPIGRPIANT
ncbi:MAG TPA: AMP-binding protein, partial [Actinomycetota bacterium]|nr:AMP-binding protein [Actinomycetota bacterium]